MAQDFLSQPMPERQGTSYRRTGVWLEDTLSSELQTRARDEPAASAVRLDGSTRLTYGQLASVADQLARGFHVHGFRRGDVVGVQLPNTLEFIIVSHALARIGCAICLLHMPYRIGELTPLLTHSRAKGVVCGSETAKYDAPGTMLAMQARASTLSSVVVVGDVAPEGCVTTAQVRMMGSTPTVEIGDPPGPADPAVFSFTSGTTSAPKCVVRTHRTLLENHRMVVKAMHLTENDRILSAPPYSHVYGFCALNLALTSGGAAVLMPTFSPASFVAALQDATVAFAAPAHLAASIESGALDDADLSSLRRLIFAGATCSPELARQVEDRLPNGRVGQMWGMTETLMGLVTRPEADANERYFTIGRPVQGLSMRISREDGYGVTENGEGELEVAGGSVTDGYHLNDAANQASFSEDGWFRTGDLCVLDNLGNVRMTGRKKDIVNRGGIKFNPADVEEIMLHHPAVIQAAVVGIPDVILGERACLCLVLRPAASLDLETVLQYLNQAEVAKVKWPESLRILSSLPMTPTNKVIKSELKALIAFD